MKRKTTLMVLDEFLWALRRQGIPISTSQTLDAMRVTALVGFEEADSLRDGLASVLIQDASEVADFNSLFMQFFAGAGAPKTFWDLLHQRGFATEEVSELREFLALVLGEGQPSSADLSAQRYFSDADFTLLLSQSDLTKSLKALQHPAQIGVLSQRLLGRTGVDAAETRLLGYSGQWVALFGKEKGELLSNMIAEHFRNLRQVTESFVRTLLRAPVDTKAPHFPSMSSQDLRILSDEELQSVKRQLRRLASARLVAVALRRKLAQNGKIDAKTTLRRSWVSSGVPLRIIRRRHGTRTPKLVVLCDISDSVRATARLLLEFVHTLHGVFPKTRSFVFIGSAFETTQMFRRQSVDKALGKIFSGPNSLSTENSNYGKAFARIEPLLRDELDHRSIVIILGDGRSNYRDPGIESLTRIRSRVDSVFWLCPEPTTEWTRGDSCMSKYAKICDGTFPVSSAQQLLTAIEQICKKT
jgi:uncharacterized protein with von Willebrand factor type A (vWA) domain